MVHLCFFSGKAKCLSKKPGETGYWKRNHDKSYHILLGSPRKNGSTSILAAKSEGGLRSRHPENQVIIKDRVYISCFGHEK